MPGTVITFIGPENFLLQEHVQKYFAAATEKYGEVNVLKIDPSALSLESIKSHLFSLPFFGNGKRVIFLTPFPLENPGKAAEKNKNDEIVSVLQELPEDVVCICIAENPDRRTRAWKNLSALADKQISREFLPLTGSQLTEWILQQFQKSGGQILPAAAEYLWQYAGTDLWKLHQEVSKLMLWQTEKPVSERDIEETAIPSFETVQFALSDAFAKGNISGIRTIFQRLVDSGENPLTLMFRDLSSILRQFILARSAVADNKTPAEVGLHPFVFQRLKKSAAKFPLNHLKNVQEKLVQIDEGVKTGLIPFTPEKEELLLLALEKWLTDFCTLPESEIEVS